MFLVESIPLNKLPKYYIKHKNELDRIKCLANL